MQNGEYSLEEEDAGGRLPAAGATVVGIPNSTEQRPPISDERSQNVGAADRDGGYDVNTLINPDSDELHLTSNLVSYMSDNTIHNDAQDAYSIPVLDLRSFNMDDIELIQGQDLVMTTDSNSSNNSLSSSALPPWRTLRQARREAEITRLTSHSSRQQHQHYLHPRVNTNYTSQLLTPTDPSPTTSAYGTTLDIPTPTSTTAYSRFVRPRRNSSPSRITVRRRTEPIRPEDQASTTLGRRVALRSAAVRRSQQQQQQLEGGTRERPIVPTSSSTRSTLTDHLYPPRAVSGSTSTSRSMHAVAAPGTTGYARQRISELLNWDDDGTFAIGLRPANVADDDADLPMLQSFSRVSSPGLVRASDYILPSQGQTQAQIQSQSWADSGWARPERNFDSPPTPPPESLRDIWVQNGRATNARTERTSSERRYLTSRDLQDFPAARTIPVGGSTRATSAAAMMLMRDGTQTQWQVAEEEGRRYRVRRRLNQDGEEYVHQIRTEGWWPEDSNVNVPIPASSSGTPTPDTIPSETFDEDALIDQLVRSEVAAYRPTRTALQRRDVVPSSATTIRRFGARNRENTESQPWPRIGITRLNADGDPLDEVPSSSRLLGLLDSQGTTSTTNLVGTVYMRMEFLPSTSSSLFPRDTTDEIEECPREDDDESNGPDDSVQYVGTDEPYYICPLPLPLPLEQKKDSEWASSIRHHSSDTFAATDLSITSLRVAAR